MSSYTERCWDTQPWNEDTELDPNPVSLSCSPGVGTGETGPVLGNKGAGGQKVKAAEEEGYFSCPNFTLAPSSSFS